MHDKETVIKAYEYLNWYFTQDDGTADKNAVKAWEVLRQEQEPVKTEPVRFRVCRAGVSNYPFWDCVCDGCGYKTSMAHTDWRFCPVCGKAVKWEVTGK